MQAKTILHLAHFHYDAVSLAPYTKCLSGAIANNSTFTYLHTDAVFVPFFVVD